jgi:hypothetical protein
VRTSLVDRAAICQAVVRTSLVDRTAICQAVVRTSLVDRAAICQAPRLSGCRRAERLRRARCLALPRQVRSPILSHPRPARRPHWLQVAFDPLDGSSIVGANWAVGSIFGVWPGSSLVGRTGREQAAAAYAVYGPRTLFVLARPVAGAPSPPPPQVPAGGRSGFRPAGATARAGQGGPWVQLAVAI